MAPHFAATGAPRAAGRMQVLPMTQHAWRPMLGMKENNELVDPYTVLCSFMGVCL
jgi:hypothetical protein